MTGLLSSAQREFLRGDREVQNPDQYLRNIRYRVRQMFPEIEEDLDILETCGEDEVRREFLHRFGSHQRLADDVEQLHADVDGLRDEIVALREEVRALHAALDESGPRSDPADAGGATEGDDDTGGVGTADESAADGDGL